MEKYSKGSVIIVAIIFLFLGLCTLALIIPIAISSTPTPLQSNDSLEKWQLLKSLLIFGIGFIVSSIGLFTRKNTARYIAIIFSAISALMLLLSVRVTLITSKNLFLAVNNTAIPLGLAIFLGFVIYYLMRPKIKEQFSR